MKAHSDRKTWIDSIEAKLRVQSPEDDAMWRESSVSTYLSSHLKGLPFVECPNHLLPSKDEPPLNWIVLSPDAVIGFVVRRELVNRTYKRYTNFNIAYFLLVIPLALILYYLEVAIFFDSGSFILIYVVPMTIFIICILTPKAIYDKKTERDILSEIVKSKYIVVLPIILSENIKSELEKLSRRQRNASLLVGGVDFVASAIGLFVPNPLVEKLGSLAVTKSAEALLEPHIEQPSSEQDR